MSVIERVFVLQKELDKGTKAFEKLKKSLSHLPIEKIIEYMSEYTETLKTIKSHVKLENISENDEYWWDHVVHDGKYIDVYMEYLEKYKSEISELMKYIKLIMEKAEKLESRADEEIAILKKNKVYDEEWEDVKSIAHDVKTKLKAIYTQAEKMLKQIQNRPNFEKDEEELKTLCYKEQTKVRTKDIIKKIPFWRYDFFMGHIEDFTSGRISKKIFWDDELWIKRRLAEFGIKEEERYFENLDLDSSHVPEILRVSELQSLARKYPTLFPGWYNDKGEFLWDLYWDKINNSSMADRFKHGIKRVVKRVKRKIGVCQKQKKQNTGR